MVSKIDKPLRNDVDYKTFPKQWIGLIESLSSSDSIERAESWFAESKWHLSSWTMEPLWPDLIKVLCQEEPCCVGNSLKFLPKIQLLPLPLQRNLLAFILNHALEVSTESLVLLRDCYGNPDNNLTDQWSVLHIKHIENKIGLRRSEGFKFKACDLVTNKINSRITRICNSLKGDDTKETGESKDAVTMDTSNFQVKEKHFSEIVKSNIGSSFQHDLMNQKDGVKGLEDADHLVSTSGVSDHLVSSVNRDGELGTARVTGTVILNSKQTNAMSRKTSGHTNMTETLGFRQSSVTTTKTNTDDMIIDEQKDGSGSVNNEHGSFKGGSLKRLVEGNEIGVHKTAFETEQKKQRLVVPERVELMHEEEGQLSADVKMKLEKVGHFWQNSQKSPVELSFLGNLNNLQINTACRILNLEELDTKNLTTVSQEIAKMSDNLPITTVAVFAKNLFMKKILDLIHPPSRPLMNAMLVFTNAFPITIVQCILVPIVQSDKFAASQCNLVTTLIKGALNIDNKHEFLRNIFKANIPWNIHVIMCIQLLIDAKIQIDDSDCSIITSGMQHQACHLSSCPKFAKLLHAFVKKHGCQLNSDHVTTLRKVVDSNKTFLKKSVMSAIDKIEL